MFASEDQHQNGSTEPPSSSNQIEDLELHDNPNQEKNNLVDYNSNTGRQHFGSSLPLMFRDGKPLYTIGPHCNSQPNLFQLILYA